MVLNYIWVGFFLIAFVAALLKLIIGGDQEVFSALFQATMDASKVGFEISIGLTGVLTFWLGIVKVGEKGGMINAMIKVVGPFFQRLFPGIPKNHPVLGPILLNISANILGLDNAATPLGLKAMEGMQELNTEKDTASNAQIMFLVLNTSGLTIFPINIMVYRAQAGAADPADIFLPILLATFFSTIAGLIIVSLYQRINLLNRVVLLYLTVSTLIIGGIIALTFNLEQAVVTRYSSLSSHLLLMGLIVLFIGMATAKKVNVYESFIEGAKEGFSVAIKIIPYLVAMLVAIAVFRASGAMGYLINGLAWGFSMVGFNTDFVEALPTAFMKPLSGSGARTMMIDTMNTYGADSFPGRVACVLQGSTETTLYVLAVYFGAVNIKNTRYAVVCGLFADFMGIIAAILISYLFFH
ncbi:MAG: nucleoside recognition domain-containing protein [Cyclobacteriaceae bacterium]